MLRGSWCRDLKQVVLIGDRLGTKGTGNSLPRIVPEIAKHFTVVDLTGLPMVDVKQRVAALPDTAALVYLGLFTDGAGVSFNPNIALQVISEVANRPIIIDTETFVGAGGVGGPVTSLNRIGEDAARLAWRDSQRHRRIEHSHQRRGYYQAAVRLAAVATIRHR